MELRRMKDGRYYRNIGYLDQGGQPKFYLGRDPDVAGVRAGQIGQVWKLSIEWARISGVEPTWFGWTYKLARAIASGEPYQPHDAYAEKLARELGVPLADAGGGPVEANGAKVGQTLHAAMAAYLADVRQRYDTLWGDGKARQLEFLRARVPDRPLARLDTPAIEAVVAMLAARPPAARGGRPVSVAWSRAVIKEFRVFLRWLNRSRQWQWTRPHDYEVSPVRVDRTQEERARITSLAVQTYTPGELKTLWEYAVPWERLLMALGLNCGFGMAEIATLRADEVVFDQPHPYAGPVGLDPAAVGSWVRRLRGKSDVYGEWRLWPETVAALGWVTANRPHPSLVVTTKAGTMLHPRDRRNNQIAHAWLRLTARVRKDHPAFPRRSFNKLRKTAVNLVRQAAGEEVAALFASHGRPVHDDLMRVYANPRWAALHTATQGVRERLAEVFVVPAPFPPGEVRGGPNVSRGKVAEIQRLAAEGLSSAEIGQRVGVSRETARRWVKRAAAVVSPV